MGTSTSPACSNRAGQGEDLGPLALGRAERGVPAAAAQQDGRHVGVGFDVVEQRGLAPQAALRGEGRSRARLAAVALDRGEQGGFFAADEGPRAHADFQVEIEAGAEDILAEQAALAALADGDLEPLDRQRIFRPHVDVAHRRPDRVRRDGHPLEDAVGIAFEDAAVHERPGVAFVGVADDEFLLVLGVAGEFPLPPGGEARPAAAAQSGHLDRSRWSRPDCLPRARWPGPGSRRGRYSPRSAADR